jgi:hypothetical protein
MQVFRFAGLFILRTGFFVQAFSLLSFPVQLHSSKHTACSSKWVFQQGGLPYERNLYVLANVPCISVFRRLAITYKDDGTQHGAVRVQPCDICSRDY